MTLRRKLGPQRVNELRDELLEVRESIGYVARLRWFYRENHAPYSGKRIVEGSVIY